MLSRQVVLVLRAAKYAKGVSVGLHRGLKAAASFVGGYGFSVFTF